jgi:hypothetical protein
LKNLTLLLILLVSNVVYGQTGILPLDELKQASYSDRVAPQKMQAAIYKDVQDWITDTFGSYENAVTKQDPESGSLVINTYTPVSTSLYDYIRFDLTIICRDNHYEARISNLDGTALHRTPIRLGIKENNLVAEKEMAVKTESNRKKRTEAELALERAKADNDNINNAMFKVLASLKEFLVNEK